MEGKGEIFQYIDWQLVTHFDPLNPTFLSSDLYEIYANILEFLTSQEQSPTKLNNEGEIIKLSLNPTTDHQYLDIVEFQLVRYLNW